MIKQISTSILIFFTFFVHSQQQINEQDLIESLQNNKSININLGEIALDFDLHTKKQLGEKTVYYGKAKKYNPSIIAITFDSKQATGEVAINEIDKTWNITSDNSGNLIFTEDDEENHSCMHIEAPVRRSSSPIEKIPPAQMPNGIDISKLESYPESEYIIYIDTDGEVVSGDYWNSRYTNGADINAQSPNLSDDEIYEIWQIMSEDYKPFDVNVTTRRDIYDTAHYSKSIMLIVTNTKSWQNVSTTGIGRYWSLKQSDSPCFSFPNGFVGWGNNQMLGEVSTHEIGHALGLKHDGNTSTNYYSGHGIWAPIMGSGYYKNVTQFSKGEFSGANNTEDDLSIITGAGGLHYKTDDHGNNSISSTHLVSNNSKDIDIANNNGVIEQSSDSDFFSFYTGGGLIDLSFNGAIPKPNLDIKATLYNESLQEVLSSDTPEKTFTTINTTLTPGTYYIKIEGVGYGNPLNTGYSDYGSLGYYSISGTIEKFSSTDSKPIVNIIEPADGSVIQMNPFQSVTLKASATDKDGTIDSVNFSIDGQNIQATLQNSYYIANWTPNTYKSYTISVTATDSDGKIDSKSINISIEAPPTQHDIALLSISNIEANTCGAIVNPKVTIENIGQQTLTSYTLEIFIDGISNKTINKTSSLSTGQTSVVDLGSIDLLTNGNHLIKMTASNPNNSPDENTTNNVSIKETEVLIGDFHEFFIAERSLSPSLSWVIQNNNTTIHSSSSITPIVSQGNSISEFCLASGCYDIIVTDAFSSGTCSANEWSSTIQYCSEEVAYKGRLYKAKWCAAGNPPDELNYQWDDLGECELTYDTDTYGLRKKNSNDYFSQNVATYNSPTTHNFCNGSPLSLDITNVKSSINVYPNPVINTININGTDIISSELVNSVGVIEKTSTNQQIEISELTPGLYILKVKTTQGVQSFHVIKE